MDPNNSTTWILGLCLFNFNSGTIGKTRVAPKTSKTATVCQINMNQRNTKLEILKETGRYLQLCSFTVSHCTISWSPVAVPNMQFLHSLLCFIQRGLGNRKGPSSYLFTSRRSGFQKHPKGPSSACPTSLHYPRDRWTKIPH